MAPDVFTRPARLDEAEKLTQLTLRSKAHWGYSPEFVENLRDHLTVTKEQLAQGEAWVAESDDELLGYFLLSFDGDEPELWALFVDPSAIGTGLGKKLFALALERAALAGLESLLIESDPNAEAFYLSQGAVREGERMSAAGRAVPLLRISTRR